MMAYSQFFTNKSGNENATKIATLQCSCCLPSKDLQMYVTKSKCTGTKLITNDLVDLSNKF